MADTNPFAAPDMSEQSSDNPFNTPDMIEGGVPPVPQSGAFMAGVRSAMPSLGGMAGEAEGFGGRLASKAGATGLGDWLHQRSQQAAADYAAGQDGSNTIPADAGTVSRAGYGIGQGLGQVGIVGGGGAATGAAIGAGIGSLAGGVGAIPGAIAGGVLGWTIANVAALPALMGFSQAGRTAEAVSKAGGTDAQALEAGTMTGAATGAQGAVLGLLGPLGKVIGKAPTGSIVETALNATAGDIAKSTLKASAVGAGANVAATAATQGIEGQYGVGDGITGQGLIDSALVGAGQTALLHAPAEAIHSAKTRGNFGVLSDPTADINDRQKAAAAAVAAISTRDPELAQDFGVYSAVQIARGLPIDLAGDHVYSAFAQDAKDQAARYAAGQAQSQPGNNSFTPGQGDQTFGPAPTDNSLANPVDTSQQGQDINRPLPSDPNQFRSAILRDVPPMDSTPPIDANDIPAGIDALTQANALDEHFLDNALAATHRMLSADADRLATELSNPDFTGVPTADVSEQQPTSPAEQQFYAEQANQAQGDLRNQAFAANEALNAPPAVPADAFAQRQSSLADEAQRLRDQGHLTGVYDQAMNAPERNAPAQAQADAVAAAAGPATPSPLSTAMTAEMNRLAQRNQSKLTTSQLGTLATHHPDEAVRQAAQQVLNGRRNRALVEDTLPNPENVSDVQPTGEMSGMRGPGKDAAIEFSPERGESRPADRLAGVSDGEGSHGPEAAPLVAPEVKPLKDSLDAEARSRGLDAAGDFEHVTRDMLPDKATDANNGVEGARTLSKSDFDNLKAQADIFGKKVTLFRQNNARPGEALDGAVLSNDPHTIFVNADASGAHHSVVMGHELAHQMETDAPKLYNAMSRAIMKQARTGGLADFAKYYGEPGDMKDPAVRRRVTSEFVSDLVGNRFPEMNTWRQVFAGADKSDRGLVYRIAHFVTNFIDKLMASAKFKRFATDDMVKNLNEVRQQVRRGLTDYANQQGMARMQHEAEQLRAAKANRDEATLPAKKLAEPVKVEPRADVGKPETREAPAPVKPREPEPAQQTKPVEKMAGPRRQESPARNEPEQSKPPTPDTPAPAPEAPPTVQEPAEHPYNGMTEDQFIQKINPEGKRLAASERPTVYQDDIEGMMPKDATRLYRDAMTTPDGDRVQFYRTKDGSVYATVDGKEVGFASALDKGTDLTVAQEYQRQGIGAALSRLYRQENPLAESGGLTEAGEAAARSAFRTVKGKLDESASKEPEQEKETSTANPYSSDPEVRKSGERASYLGNLSPAQELAAKAVGMMAPRESFKQKTATMRKDLGMKMQQGIADQFAPIRTLDEKAYQLARLAKGSDGALEAALMYGAPTIRDGAYDVDVNGKGFGKIMGALEGEHNRFLLWEAAHRAEELKAQGRENLFTDSDISALKTLDKSDAQHPNRQQKFAQAQKEYRAFNEQMLKIAKDSGIMSDADYQLFKDQPYVPFYRVMEDAKDGGMSGPGGKTSGLVNQYAYKKLKGGKSKLNDDLMANVLTNWSHLLGASSRNRAAKATMDAAEKLGVAHQIPASDAGKGTVRVRDGGKDVHYEIDDPHLLSAVSAMSQQVPKWMKPLSTFKHLLTHAVTVMPGFKVRNLIRDSISALAVGDLSPNIPGNIAEGIKGTSKKSQTYASMLASGGIIRMGSLMDGNEAQRAHRLIQQGVPAHTILNKSMTDRLFSQAHELYEAYQELGDRSENINRAALYQQLIKQGKTHAEAAFMSRDMMDFSMQGNWPVIRFLTQSVPFMNARIQGLYKLGKAGVEHPGRVGAVVGATMMASLALAAAYKDDPDWKKREDWDRDNYWWFKMGGTAFRIPKPFEVGAAGSLAERTYELMTDKEMTAKRYGGRIADLLGQQFSLNPTPQIVKPLMDVYANKDGFTGRPIENEAMQGLQPEDRYSQSTSMTARFLGQLGLPDPVQLIQGRYSPLSPVQMDSLMHGYFGSLGALGLGVTDSILRPATGQASAPSSTLANWTDNAVENLPGQNSRYVTAMYDNLNQIEQAYNSYHTYLKTGQLDKARAEMADNRSAISSYPMAEAAKRAMSQMSQQEKRILNDTSMSAGEKRVRLDALNQRKNALAQRIALRELDRSQAE